MVKLIVPPIQISIPTPLAVGPVNAYLFRGDEPALVDTGPNHELAWQGLLAGLAAHGLEPAALRHIFITHAHVDHFGNGARLAEVARGATIYAPDLAHARPTLLDLDEEWERYSAFAECALLASGLPAEVVGRNRGELARLRSLASAVPVTRWVRPGEWLQLGGVPWQVVALPGHSMTQVGLHQPDARLLLAADHLLPRISSNALLEPPAPGVRRRPRALPQYVRSLRWTAELPPHTIFPGHGDVFEDQRPLIERRLCGIEERAGILLEALIERPHTVIALVRRLFPDLAPAQLFLAVSEVVGHLDLLEERGLVRAGGERVRLYYAVSPQGRA